MAGLLEVADHLALGRLIYRLYNKSVETVEELKQQIEKLEHRVFELEKDLIHDSLTGLKTRRFLVEESGICLHNISKINKTPRKDWFNFKHFSLLFIDIDYFKKINDTYGHDVGDMVLVSVSKAIQHEVREGDTVARWGGEEIVASLLGADEKDAGLKAESIRRIIESLVFESNPDLKVTISVGVSTYEQGLSLKDIIKRADTALYKAKETGRNKVVLYSETKSE